MRFEWDSKKNEWLKSERSISFEQVIYHLLQGDIWKVSDHPDQENYPRQRLYFVKIKDYIYVVPHVVEEDYIFLKTIIPSRKATKLYRESQEV